MSVELANAYWTSEGPVEVHFGREWSLFDFAKRCAQAAETGFVGLGLWHADIEHQLETRSFEDMRLDLDNNGLRCFELEFLWDWFVDPDDDARKAADAQRRMLFDAAAGKHRFAAHQRDVRGRFPCPARRRRGVRARRLYQAA